MSTLSNGRAQRLLTRMAAADSAPRCARLAYPRAPAIWSSRATHQLPSIPSSCMHFRRFATSPSPPPPFSPTATPSSHSSPSIQPSRFAPLPATPTPNPHLSVKELSAEQLDAILRAEQQRRLTVHSKQQQLDQLLQQLQQETSHDEAHAAITRYERLVRALTHQQRGVKLLAVLLAITSLACSMQLLVAKDRTQQSLAAARHLLDERRDTLAVADAALDSVTRRLREYLALRIAEAGTSNERAWLEALQRRVWELEAAGVSGVDELKARQAVQALERDINARYDANKRKPWW